MAVATGFASASDKVPPVAELWLILAHTEAFTYHPPPIHSSPRYRSDGSAFGHLSPCPVLPCSLLSLQSVLSLRWLSSFLLHSLPHQPKQKKQSQVTQALPPVISRPNPSFPLKPQEAKGDLCPDHHLQSGRGHSVLPASVLGPVTGLRWHSDPRASLGG